MKSYFIAAVILLTTITTHAQMKLGPVAGLNVSTWSTSISTVSAKAGAQFGAVVTIQMSTHILVETGIQYSMKGVATLRGNDEGKLHIDYMEVPVNLRYVFGHEGTGFHIGIGPYLGVLISARSIYDGNEDNVTDDYNDTDLGLNFGMGYQFRNGIGIVTTYGMGLTNVIKNNYYKYSARNTNIQLSLRYLFTH